ncbi:flagellar basal-body rod protein FlgF [Pseudomonas nicosulfuronedens]|uniref:Flagellar basal-body rod protein FlgF n=1 Tax=Pseudomonas nicosulfuronedens TaxID=2571105 RepID=A0A5R9RRS4_9PSED|nr:flagellar basal-body rod protein FlgF [Pseudomonas nicosulfuronedens]MDH1010622.1 flagellar basal-body rod protein FlgF [Pseudomonas nicosulfuronedens]MDH1979716.1 flagellar basal-body rod protein FlgF [Pseudomonas nicosulfuronedens]MDH2028151.1 flagellar basal-body rod protein FlgF [Pseudomonas nicosulfuronedens]TLX80231.1 flagellar basal-body rod protein FlgF [Pseudomonas nicosulfuronedens]
MDRMLYVAMSGASQNTKAMQAHANNLANISTTGFRRDFEQARAMPVFGDSFPARVFAMSERPATDFTTGSLQETGRDLDVAAKGDAWIAVQAPDGGEAYVRTGSLEIDALGQLRTGDGMPVMGNGGPIAIPPEEKIDIGQDGTITVRGQGNQPNALATVDRIKLVTLDPKQLEKGSDGLIRLKSGQPAPQADANAGVQSGVLEASNVNAVDEMTSILALSRQFELHVKMMKTAEEDSQSMARVLQFS